MPSALIGRSAENGTGRFGMSASESRHRTWHPDVLAKRYGRLLPQDKSALATKILNQVWQATWADFAVYEEMISAPSVAKDLNLQASVRSGPRNQIF